MEVVTRRTHREASDTETDAASAPATRPSRSKYCSRAVRLRMCNNLLTTNVPAYVDVANVVRVLPADEVRAGWRREDLVGTRVDRACKLKHPVAIDIDPPKVEVSTGTPAYRAGREVELERRVTTRAQRLKNGLVTAINRCCLPAADARLEVCAWRSGRGINLLGRTLNERKEEKEDANDETLMLEDERHCLCRPLAKCCLTGFG